VIAITDDVWNLDFDGPNQRGHSASLDTGSIDITTLAIAADLEKIKMMTFDQIEQPQPTSDFEIAKNQRVVSETWLYLPRLIARTA